MSDILQKLNNNYRLSLLLSLIIGICLSIAVCIIIGPAALSIIGVPLVALPEAIGGIIFTLGLTSALVSGATYIGRAFDYGLQGRTLFDIIRGKPKRTSAIGKFENIGNIIGLICAAVISIGVLVSTIFLLPYTPVSQALSAVIVFMTSCGVFGGLCSRVGRFFDGLLAPNKATPAVVVTDSQDNLILNPSTNRIAAAVAPKPGDPDATITPASSSNDSPEDSPMKQISFKYNEDTQPLLASEQKTLSSTYLRVSA